MLQLTHWPLITIFSVQPMNTGGPCAKCRRLVTVPPTKVVGKLVQLLLPPSLKLIGYIVCSSLAAKTTCDELIATKTYAESTLDLHT